jgi:hypothetical protein
MGHKLDLADFRAQRSVLDPDDFALGSEEPDPPPTDLIGADVWNGIMTLPDDVAIRTTSYQGSRIEILHDLWSGWVFSMPSKGILSEATHDIADDLQAALYNLVHGFYKQSIAACRNALEMIVFASECELNSDMQRWQSWQKGTGTLNFQRSCRSIATDQKLKQLESIGQKTYGNNRSLLPIDNTPDSKRNAWITNLYGRLCEFAHPRGTNAQLWESNGPIYSAKGMQISFYSYLETYSALIIMSKIALVKFQVPIAAHMLYSADSIKQYLPEEFHDVSAYYSDKVITG